jgi:hypothetical protein
MTLATKPLAPGGTLQRRTSKATQTVSVELFTKPFDLNPDKRLALPSVAVDALSHTIKHFCATGKFRQAADREKEIAQVPSYPYFALYNPESPLVDIRQGAE